MKYKLLIAIFSTMFACSVVSFAEESSSIINNLDPSVHAVGYFGYANYADNFNGVYRYVIINNGVEVVLSELYIQLISAYQNEVEKTINITEITNSNIYSISAPIIVDSEEHTKLFIHATNVRTMENVEIEIELFGDSTYTFMIINP